MPQPVRVRQGHRIGPGAPGRAAGEAGPAPCPPSRRVGIRRDGATDDVGTGSQVEEPGRAGRHRLGPPAVAPRCVDILLPGMGHDLLIERAIQIGFGNEAGAHAMRRQPLAVGDLPSPACLCPPSQNLPDAIAGETGFDRAGGGDAAKDGAIGDAGRAAAKAPSPAPGRSPPAGHARSARQPPVPV